MTWVGSVNGNLLREYNLPGMLVKMHACAVSVYQALSKEPGYEASWPHVSNGRLVKSFILVFMLNF